ncbi:hypothetical protein HAX54_038317 [Datura stramonium]|uniref:DUF4283 domain-containing protein n=1 Tax=Datura stramonium TaxID=4076 RepID=A0ABS8VMV8_DATST|nr:hypothetical protein [Datura stramonium]
MRGGCDDLRVSKDSVAVNMVGLPVHLWCFEFFRIAGNMCGGFVGAVCSLHDLLRVMRSGRVRRWRRREPMSHRPIMSPKMKFSVPESQRRHINVDGCEMNWRVVDTILGGNKGRVLSVGLGRSVDILFFSKSTPVARVRKGSLVVSLSVSKGGIITAPNVLVDEPQLLTILEGDQKLSKWVLQDISHNLRAVYTHNGSHCLDILPAKPSDPEWLTMQRNTEVKIIEGWITNYYADLKSQHPQK